jgi:hypothetical protein
VSERLKDLGLRWVVGPVRRRRHRRELPPPLAAEETARRLYALPVRYWTYDFEPGVRHLGPMSQDFAAAFGLGRTNRKIHMGDAHGVALVAIQDLHRRLEAVEREITQLRKAREGNTMSKDRTDKIRAVSDETASEDTEAHAFRGGIRPADADTEGHTFRHVAGADDEDTEGHARRT